MSKAKLLEKQKARGERAAAARAVATGMGLQNASSAPGPLQLQRAESEETTAKIARSLRKKRPDLGEDPNDGASAAYLAASFIAYAADEKPQSQAQWSKLLGNVLDDAAMILDEDDNHEALSCVVADLVGKGVLATPAPAIEVGSTVLAILEEDEDWHEAIVEEVVNDDLFRLIFLEFGKPQQTTLSNIRSFAAILDDEGTEDLQREGDCELCGRQLMLTFHHLIPKDTHPTYLGKQSQLASVGIDGEPTRGFLNTYGTMVCSQCHSNIHKLASNVILAKEYNTLEKIRAHPHIQRWVEWAAKQRPPGCRRLMNLRNE